MRAMFIKMRYTYTLYVDGVRKDVSIKLASTLEEIAHLAANSSWYLDVYDGLRNRDVVRIANQDELDAWDESRARDIWLDATTKLTNKQVLEEKLAMKWDPFNEKESGIHTKDKIISLTDNNVKTAAAANKPKVSAVPPAAILALGAAMQDGANKYGKFNWRTTSVSASVFYDAMMRHLVLWYAGEDNATDSNQPHLAHIMANCAILLDAKTAAVFNDDRDKKCPITAK
jgi:hypothetical protein